ncbi:ATP-binding cassette domain-containing protein [Microbacterium sp. NPDC058389]|uniref:ATP-binding cassette domain-containing protein n=1 Tax=Microbacterium sp. NPDC058389 TaxID=3346475 RepID=UPI00364692C0
MPDGQSLEFSGVTKRFGAVTAVSDLSARVEPGRVTGFLGPNGAGKTTTLRILLGLVRATSGRSTIGGRRYAELDKPLQTVGAVLEASSFHPGRTGAAHLTIYAQAAGIPKRRVEEVLGLVGLGDAGGRKVGGYSLGMRQRLGLAYALLGDPGVLVLDEPANGLDPEGIRWMRGFLRQLAAEGRTVLVSSHLLAEVQQTVDALLIISRGRLVFEGSIDDLADPSEFATVVDAPDRAALTAALSAAGLPHEVLRSGLTVRGADPTAVGAAAAAAGVALSALQRRGPALEEVFLDLVNGTRVHPSAPGVGAMSPVGEGAGVDAAPAAAAPVEAAAPEAAPVAAGVALAAAGGAAPGREAEREAREADESALASAELEAEATGAPGAAAALGAAAGAAWAAERADEPETGTPEAVASEAGPEAVAAAAAGPESMPAAAGGPEAEEPTEPGAEAEAEAVAAPESEGAPEAEPERVPAPEPAVEPEAVAATEAEGAPEPEQPEPATGAPEPEPAAETGAEPEPAAEPAVTTGAGFAVASTGVIDIVPPAEPEPEPEADAPEADAPEDADPDVEEIGAIDDELSTPEPPDEDDDRPWENYVKTDADVEADAFFASFDSGADEPADPETTQDHGVPSADDAIEPDPGEPAEARADEPAAAPEPAADEAPEAWVPPEAEAFEDAQEAASTPSPGNDDGGGDDDTGSDDHEGGRR